MENQPESPQNEQPQPRRWERPREKPKKISWWPLIIFFGVVLLMGGVVIAGAAFFAFRKPTVKVTTGSVLHLRVAGSLPEQVANNPLTALLNQQQVTFHDLLAGIRQAMIDDQLSGMFLEVAPNGLGWAQTEELRNVLKVFRQSGKWIVSYGETWEEREYYLASVANEVYMPGEGIIQLDGFASRTSFYADTLEKYGVRAHVEAFGAYKSYHDSFRYREMSEAQRESTSALLDGINETFCKAIIDERGIAREQFDRMLAGMINDAEMALGEGLLDDNLYRDQVMELLAEKAELENVEALSLVSAKQYALGRANRGGFSRDAIAVIYAVGTIRTGSSESSMFGDEVIASDVFIKRLKAARTNPRVRAIVLRIDSSGGSALASDLMWREIHKTVEMGKPVIASLGNIATSGGYYMAMACDSIIAQPTTVTGSIGIVIMRMDFEQLYQNFLVNVDVVKTSPSADFYGDHRPLTETEISSFHERTKRGYVSFVSKAAEARGKEYDDFEPLAQGRPWIGSDALDIGLVDEMGGLNRAVQKAAEAAGISQYKTINYPEEKDFWTLVQETSQVRQRAPLSEWRQLVPLELRELSNLFSRQRGLRDEPLAIMPYRIDID